MRLLVVLLGVALGLSGPGAKADTPSLEAMREYLMFAQPTAGVILPAQIDRAVFEAALFVDTRDESQFRAGTIPGAIHIEWREVLDRIDEIPTEQMTILFCNTGSLSAQAVFALRVAGRDNVLVLQTGLVGWRETAAWKP
jgi:rhodanese-related sulfurtransferase